MFNVKTMNLNKLRDEAYSIAKANGWHEQEYSDSHEEWKDIHGYEGQYQISNMGRVRSLDRMVNNHGKCYFKKGQIISDANAYGYRSVGLCKHGIAKTWLVHILVAKAFIQNPLNKRTVNHINCDKSDNRACNLEWATDSENIKHAYRNGLKTSPKTQLGKTGFKSSRGIPVQQIDRKTNKQICIFGSAHEAQKHTGVNYTDILYCCRGKLKTAGGFIWKLYQPK